MELIAWTACLFFCADKAYQWFNAERRHRLSIHYSERAQALEEQAVEASNKMGSGVERISKQFPHK